MKKKGKIGHTTTDLTGKICNGTNLQSHYLNGGILFCYFSYYVFLSVSQNQCKNNKKGKRLQMWAYKGKNTQKHIAHIFLVHFSCLITWTERDKQLCNRIKYCA